MTTERLHEKSVEAAKSKGIPAGTLKVEHCQGCIAQCVASICAVKELVDIENGKHSLREELEILEAKSKSGGIGLANIRRRLNIIYPKTHALNVIEKPNTYTVFLDLQY